MMMEKHEGIRVYWDGTSLITNGGIRVNISTTVAAFPPIPFEGVLWYRLNVINLTFYSLENTLATNNQLKNLSMNDWAKLKIIAFDAPQLLDEPYSTRLTTLRQAIPSDHPVISIVTPIPCKSRSHLEEFFTQLSAKGSEGVIVRNPTATYFESNSFYKKTVRLCINNLTFYRSMLELL
jgi:DNA ligase-1